MLDLPTASRGIYYLPWLGPNGERYITTVDRYGRKIEDRAVPADADMNPHIREMRARLDLADPMPQISLIRTA